VHVRRVSKLIDPRAPQEVQQAAIDTIARAEGSSPPSVLIPVLAGGTPALRSLVLGALLRRTEWTSELLAALESGTVPKSALDAAHRDRLLHHADATLQARAAALLAPSGTPRRAQILEQLRPVLDLHGDPSRGREPFRRLCASCHAFRGEGHALAPELAALGDRSSARLLESIVDPNAAVSADFVACDVELASGDSLAGLIRDESSTGFTIVQANAVRHAVLRRDVKAVRPSKLSLMPEGLEEGLTLQELADLIAWLQSGPAALGAIPAEQASAARDEVLRERWNGYSRRVSAFDVFSQPTWFGVCTMHYCRQTDGTAKVTWRTEPAPAAPEGGDVVFRFPAAVGFLSQPDGEFVLAVDGHPLLRFDVAIDDFHVVAPDGHSRLDFECRAANAEDATGVMTLTLPASLVKPGAPVELTVTGSAANSQRWFGVLAPKE
jgi:putative heme-binding domain-containing protein